MRKLMIVGALALLPVLPGATSAQGTSFGIGGHVGLNGYGADAAFGIGQNFDIRAGISFAPDTHFLTKLIPSDISGVEYDINIPTTTIRAGLDFHVLGPLKLIGGIMYRTEDLGASATVTEPVELGGTLYNEPGTLSATLDQNNLLPYVGIGFGHLANPGIGVYLDIGIAYSGDATVDIDASGELGGAPGIEEALQEEADLFLADTPDLIKKLYPVLELGVKIGFGG